MKWEGKVGILQRCKSQEGGGHSSLHLSASGGMSMPLAALEALSHFSPQPEPTEHQWGGAGEFQTIHTRQLWSHFTCHLPPSPGPSPAPQIHLYMWPLECSRILRTSLFSLLPPSWVISSMLCLQCICVLIPPVRIILTLKTFLRGNLY